MDSAFAILKAEYDAFKAVVAGRLDALHARVATLEKAAAPVVIKKVRDGGLCPSDTTPTVPEKPRRHAAPLGPGLFDVSSLSEEDRRKLVVVDEFAEVPASPPPTPPLTPPTAPKAAPLETLAPVKKARGRPRKAPAATSSDTPTPIAATPTQDPATAPAAPQACASVPAHTGDAKVPVLSPAAQAVSPGAQAVFREILEEHSDDALAKLWERTFGKPLAKFDKAQVVVELLTTYGDPAANFALESQEAIGADPSLKLDPDVEGLDF